MLFSDVFVIPTYTFRKNQNFPDATGYAIKSNEEQRGELLKSLLAIIGVVALFFDRYDFLSLVAILAVICCLKFMDWTQDR